jgi:hypothetical protein
VEVNKKQESGHLAKARRSVTKLGRFAESRGSRCNCEPGLRLQEGREQKAAAKSRQIRRPFHPDYYFLRKISMWDQNTLPVPCYPRLIPTAWCGRKSWGLARDVL